MEHEPETLKNPAGFLAESIRQGYQPPGKYRTPEQRAASEKMKEDRRNRVEQQKCEEASKQQQIRREREHVEAIRASLSDKELKQLETEVFEQADEIDKRALASPQSREFRLMLLVNKKILQLL